MWVPGQGTSTGQRRGTGLRARSSGPAARQCGKRLGSVGWQQPSHPTRSALGSNKKTPASQQTDLGAGMRCSALTCSLITGGLCQNGACRWNQPGNIIACGRTGGPCTRGAACSQQERLEIESSIVFPPVRVTKGQMDFHEMLLKNEKGLASGPRPCSPSQPQAKFYD